MWLSTRPLRNEYSLAYCRFVLKSRSSFPSLPLLFLLRSLSLFYPSQHPSSPVTRHPLIPSLLLFFLTSTFIYLFTSSPTSCTMAANENFVVIGTPLPHQPRKPSQAPDSGRQTHSTRDLEASISLHSLVRSFNDISKKNTTNISYGTLIIFTR